MAPKLTRAKLTVAVKWYRSTFYNALILGLCNFLAPGIWGAMNSVGGGGLEKPVCGPRGNQSICPTEADYALYSTLSMRPML
jgi:hypothetical protein